MVVAAAAVALAQCHGAIQHREAVRLPEAIQEAHHRRADGRPPPHPPHRMIRHPMRESRPQGASVGV